MARSIIAAPLELFILWGNNRTRTRQKCSLLHGLASLFSLTPNHLQFFETETGCAALWDAFPNRKKLANNLSIQSRASSVGTCGFLRRCADGRC